MNATRVIAVLGIGAVAVALAAIPPASRQSPGAYWALFTPQQAVAVERFASLAEMVASADLVVVARIKSLSPGREFGDEADTVHYAAAELEIQRVLDGVLPAGRVILELQLPHGHGASDVPRYAREAPQSSAVFILRNKGTEAEMFGLGSNRVEREAPYVRLITPGAILAESGGKVVTAGTETPFITAKAGSDFSQVVEEVDSVP